MVLLDRRRRAGRYLEWKVRLFSLGAVVALAGIYWREAWMTSIAIVILLAGMVLRFLPASRGEAPEEDEGASP